MWATVVAAVTAAATAVVVIVSSETAACSGSSPNLIAASPEFDEVDACVDIAVDGDTITIPAGSATWSTGIVIPDSIGITLTGTGTPNETSDTFEHSASCDDTVITIAQDVIGITATPDYGDATTRISCMKMVKASTRAVAIQVAGGCTSSGCPNLRVDNIFWDSSWAGGTAAPLNNGYGINAINNVFGVWDHNTITGADTAYTHLAQFHHSSYLTAGGSYGDNAWAEPDDFGTNKFIFFENNTFTHAGCCENEGDIFTGATGGGGRVVVRFNRFTIEDGINFTMGFHGTESGGRIRGGRAFEYYGNFIDCDEDACDSIAGARSGTGMVWGNTISNSIVINTFFTLTTNRRIAGFTAWQGACDGSSPFDLNDGVEYFAGTISAGEGSDTFTISGSPGWMNDQWLSLTSPYSLHDVTQDNGGEIVGNTSNTITIRSARGIPGWGWSPQNGDSIQILRATRCIDQAGGAGEGILYDPDDPAMPLDPANQAWSPLYSWMNTFVTAPTYCRICPNSYMPIRNREFFDEDLNQAAQTSSSAPFDGSTTVGMGHGIASRKPSTCTDGAGTAPGVGYFATDEGSWNTSGNGFGNGRLYLCTASNTWTLSYTPYTYPHDLITGGEAGGGPPAAEKVMIR